MALTHMSENKSGFSFGFRVPVAGFSDQVNLKCILKACVCAFFL